jgi:hypothetical protein
MNKTGIKTPGNSSNSIKQFKLLNTKSTFPQISASQVARITGMSHWRPAREFLLLKFKPGAVAHPCNPTTQARKLGNRSPTPSQSISWAWQPGCL